jgi:hypothetical protein
MAESRDAQALLEITDEALAASRVLLDRMLERQYATWFTDNLVVAFPSGKGHRMAMHALTDAIWTAAALQLSLLQRNMIARGAITFGPHFMDDRIVFGPALVSAARLEALGGPPRVLLSWQAHNRLIRARKKATPTKRRRRGTPPRSLKQIVVIDETEGERSIPFVNYLRASTRRVLGRDREEILNQHRSLIRAGFGEHAEEPGILDKYKWLASYDHWYRVAFKPAKRAVLDRRADVGTPGFQCLKYPRWS